MNPANQNINNSAYNTFIDDESTFTANASEVTKYSKNKRDKENKTNKVESMRNGKNIQTPSNNLTINQNNKTNSSIIDYSQQNSTFLTVNNKILSYNNPNVLANKLLNTQTNIENTENLNFSNQMPVKGLHKNNSLNNQVNNNPKIVNTKAISGKIIGAAPINPLQGSLNPYLIQSSNIPISLNVSMPIANQTLINPMNQLVGNITYTNPCQSNTKNNLENSAFLNSQNININSNLVNIEAESEDESKEAKEDEYVLELIYSRRFSELSDKDLLSNLFLIAKEQAGCRFLQQKIDDNPNFANYELYPEIHEYIGEFICDPFGNYLVQKMLESLTTDKINHMMKNVNKKIIKCLKIFLFFNILFEYN